METRKMKSFLTGIPSWVQALLTLILAYPVLMIVVDLIAAIFGIPESEMMDLVFYSVYNLIIAYGCLVICRHNPRSIWYVPLICNAAGLVSAMVEENFWSSTMWIVICSGWLLSAIASLIGMFVGKRETTARS